MINLLPKTYRGELKKVYRLRVATLALTFFIVVVGIFLIVLGAFSFLLWVEKKQVTNEINALSENSISVSDQMIIQEVAAQLSILERDVQLHMPTVLFEKIIDAKSNNIKLTKLNFIEGRDSVTISFDGMSDTRNTLLSFLSRLEKEELFDEVDSPLSSLSKSVNIPFDVTIRIEKKLPSEE